VSSDGKSGRHDRISGLLLCGRIAQDGENRKPSARRIHKKAPRAELERQIMIAQIDTVGDMAARAAHSPRHAA
jgi:hypothetical protein